MDIISIIIIIILLPIAISGFSLAPFVPSRTKDQKRINKLANLKKNELFYELGSGNGKVAIYIAKHNRTAKVFGFELAYTLYIISKIRSFNIPNLRFINKNIFNVDLSNVDVIYVYGMPKVLANKLKEKFQKELKKGSRIISYVFKIEGMKPILIDKPSKKDASIYVYKI